MANVDLNDAQIHYEERNAQAARAVVLLHGFPLSGKMWKPQLEAMGTHWRLTAPDFRGFGQSSATGPFSIAQLADDVHAFAEKLYLGKFVLAGLSMGGYVALAYAKKYHATLDGLILLDTKAEPDAPDGKDTRNRMIEIAKQRGARPIADAMLPKLLPAEAMEHRPQLARELRDMMEGTNPQTIAQALAAMRDREDQTATLAKITVPTLVIVGEKDGITPPAVMQAMQAKILHSTNLVVKGAGHMSNMEQPAQVNQAMAKFLDGL